MSHPFPPDHMIWLRSGDILTLTSNRIWHWDEGGALRASWALPEPERRDSSAETDDDHEGEGDGDWDDGDWNEQPPLSLAASNDACTVLVALGNGMVGVLRDGMWATHAAPLEASCFAVAPSGEGLVFGTTDGEICFTDVALRERGRARLAPGETVVGALHLSDDELLAYTTGHVARIDVRTRAVLWQRAPGSTAAAADVRRGVVAVDTPIAVTDASDADLHFVAHGGVMTFAASTSVRILDLRDGQLISEMHHGDRPMRYFGFTASGELVGASDKGLLIAERSVAHFQTASWRYPGFLTEACVSPTGESIASLHTLSSFVHIWDPRTATQIGGGRAAPTRLHFASNRMLHGDGCVFDPSNGTTRRWRANAFHERTVVSPDTRRAAVVGGPNSSIEVFDVEARANDSLTYCPAVHGTVLHLAWTSDSTRLIARTQINTARDTSHALWEIDVEARTCMRLESPVQRASFGALVMLNRDREVLVATQDANGLAWWPGGIAFWNGVGWQVSTDGSPPVVHDDVVLLGTEAGLELRCRTSGAAMLTITEPGRAGALGYHHGSGLLAVAMYDGEIELWDIAAQRAARLQHGFEVRALAFSEDGDLLASADVDGTVIVWDVAAIRAAAGVAA